MPGAVEMGKDAVPYGEPTYWDERYQTSREKLGPDKYYFDWYCTFEDIWPTLQTYCGKEMVEATHNVLVIGCGNSRLPERMWAAGFRSITCIDISSTVISHMQARYVDREGMDFLCMDAKRMDRFPDDQFDLIIEKACMDSMFASYVSYNGVLVANQEVCRVLKVRPPPPPRAYISRGVPPSFLPPRPSLPQPHKKFVSVSLGSPQMRMPHFGNIHLSWDVDHAPLLGKQGIHLYVCTKRGPGHPLYELAKKEEARALRASRASRDDGEGDDGDDEELEGKKKTQTKDLDIGDEIEEVDEEWEKRKNQPSQWMTKDKWTIGKVRIMAVRDADMLLQALAVSRGAAAEAEGGAAPGAAEGGGGGEATGAG